MRQRSKLPAAQLRSAFTRPFARRAGLLDTVLGNISQGVCMFDAALRLRVCNERYLEMYQRCRPRW
jgi:hypothetical protein